MMNWMRKNREKSGFTLIELMVTIVLVLILALALVPTFTELLTKAKYAEAAAAISAVNTKIKVYWVENGRLPGVSTSATDVCVSSMGTALDNDIGSGVCGTQRFLSQSSHFQYYLSGNLAVVNTTVSSADYSNQYSRVQRDLDISHTEYAGTFFLPEDYQVLICNGGATNSEQFMYAVAAAGQTRTDRKSAPTGTGYAVMTIQCPGVANVGKDVKIVAEFARYRPETESAGTQLALWPFDSVDTLPNQLLLVPNAIPVPSWNIFVSTMGTGGGPAGGINMWLEDNYGFSID